jgi:murein DD-endopeptidase MepM/ murein hydrolase activator NlpD
MVQRRPAQFLRRVLVVLAAAAVVGTAVAGPGARPALADPTNPTDGELGAARSQQDAAAADVGRIAALVASAESELERYSVQAEAAGAASMAAQEAFQQAQQDADAAAARLAAADAQVAAAQQRIAGFSHDSYVQGASMTRPAALLSAQGPGELIEKAAMLEWVGSNQVDVLGQLEVARTQQASADAAARAARDRTAAARAAADAAKAKADEQVAAEQAAVATLNTQKAGYEQQLQAAQVHLLELQGARNAYEQWVAQRQAAAAAASAAAAQASAQAAANAAVARSGGGGGYVLPAAGITSSCFGSRWGVEHLGIDIAASIGTPIYAATSGLVRRAGPADGFGLALYIQGDDGAVTVYGHVNRYFVQAGQRVGAGQQIAEVGNRGQSTGPHLHFEVHPNGAMYSGAVDPAPWLRARGVAIDGC